MQNRSNLRCRLRSPMRHADTSGLHRVVPYVGCVSDEIRVNTVKSPLRRLVPGPYEGPVVLYDLRVMGFLGVAAYRCSLGYTCAVPLEAGRCPAVISHRVGGYGVGLCRLPSSYQCRASDFLCCAVSLPRLGLTILQWASSPRVVESAYPVLLLPVCANVPFP
jgi:hypothetical protein